MTDVEQWREEFETLAKAKGLSVERKAHAFVDVEYYVSEQTLWLWSGYLEGRRANSEAVLPHCDLGQSCVCGGDTPRVRAGCRNWVE